MTSSKPQVLPFYEQWNVYTGNPPDWLSKIIIDFAPPPSIQAIKLIFEWL